MSWLLKSWRFTRAMSLSCRELLETAWERNMLTVLLLCIEVAGRSGRGDEMVGSCFSQRWFEAGWASDAELYLAPSPNLCLLFLCARNLPEGLSTYVAYSLPAACRAPQGIQIHPVCFSLSSLTSSIHLSSSLHSRSAFVHCFHRGWPQ